MTMRSTRSITFQLRTRGFSILELAIVLLILSALTASLIGPVSNYIQQQKIVETKKILEETREALLGFAAANGRLPRPATSASNGLEGNPADPPLDCLQGSSGAQSPKFSECAGFIPWQTLGTPRTDAWGNLIKYAVVPCAAIQTSQITFNIKGADDLKVQTRTASGNRSTLANNLLTIIWSTGQRNYGWPPDATSGLGNNAALDGTGQPTNIDEIDNDRLFQGSTQIGVTRDFAQTGANGGEFDDLLVWIPKDLAFSRLLNAGRTLTGNSTEAACTP